MSNKLAKVLLICALVVCIPLFVAGTVLAVYFSMNASTNVAIYVNNVGSQYGDLKNPVIKSSGRVTNNLDDEDAKYDVYTITNSHLKTTNIEFQTDGYNFVGWFNGDYDAYVKALADATAETPVEYFSTENMLSVKTADYQNLTAVFAVKTFAVSYNYDSDPDNDGSGEGTTTVPEGGSASYDYGAPLPVLADTYKNHFLGWSVNGGEEIYTSAMFNGIEGEIVLNAVWQEYPEFSYSISYDYSNWNADLEEGEDPVETSVVAITTKLDEIQLPSLDAYQKEGKTAYWGDENGNEVTAITTEMLNNYAETKVVPLKVYYQDITYSINVVTPVNVSFVGETNVEVAYSNLDSYLTEVFKATNWSHNLYKNTWDFKGLKFNETVYANTTEDMGKLKNAIISAEGAITLEGVVECQYTNFVVKGTLSAVAIAGSVTDGISPIEPQDFGEEGYKVNMNESIYYYADSGETGLFGTFDLINEFYYQEDNSTVVMPISFSFEYNGEKMQYQLIDFTADDSIYSLIEKIVIDKDFEIAGTEFSISNITIHFEPVEMPAE